MEISIITAKTDAGTIITLGGKLNTVTSQELASELERVLPEATSLTIEMKDLDYVSSAGLRLLVTAQKQMKAKGSTLTIKNVQDDVLEVFEMTGLSGVFNITKE